MAKLAGVAHLAAIRQQYGLPYICAVPTSQYGPGDNFDLRDGHVSARDGSSIPQRSTRRRNAGDLLGDWATQA